MAGVVIRFFFGREERDGACFFRERYDVFREYGAAVAVGIFEVDVDEEVVVVRT